MRSSSSSTQPAAIGHCDAAPANFGPTITAAGFTDDVVVATDPADAAGMSTTDGCTAFTNAAAVAGNFAFIDRGTCPFTAKIANAVAAGASGIVFGNNVATALVSVAGVAPIPGLMVTQAKGTEIKAAAALGTVTATMRATDTTPKADSYRWLVSEKATAFGGAIRDMWAPTCYGDPGKVSDVRVQLQHDRPGRGALATRVFPTMPTPCWSMAGRTTTPPSPGSG